jgi:hypothetical protein
MEANIGHRPSYAWRSITSARLVLRTGLRWHIGDGRSVRILKDPWLPLSSSFGSHLAAGLLDPNEKVSMLISDEGQCWNRELIYGLFSNWESDVICSIPLPPRKKPDRLFWNVL